MQNKELIKGVEGEMSEARKHLLAASRYLDMLREEYEEYWGKEI